VLGSRPVSTVLIVFLLRRRRVRLTTSIVHSPFFKNYDAKVVKYIDTKKPKPKSRTISQKRCNFAQIKILTK